MEKTSRKKRYFVSVALRMVGIALILFGIERLWMGFLGLFLTTLSFLSAPKPCDAGQRNTVSRLFAAFSILLTFGAVLMLVGISWITFIGLSLVIFAFFFSSRWPATSRSLAPLLICLGG